MREIKFRAWDNYNEKWLKDYDFNIRLDNWNIQKNLCAWTIWWIEINQFTWLKDKNWVDIYEGDIIEHQQYLYQVVWNFDRIKFVQIKTTITDFSMYTDWWECLKENYWRYYTYKQLFNFGSCEIKWNIYENPLQSN